MDEKSRKKLVRAALRLADARANDVALLAYLPPEGAVVALDRMDLTMLESLERTPTGGMKVKVLDRVGALRCAMECLDRVGSEGGMDAFLAAMQEGGGGED